MAVDCQEEELPLCEDLDELTDEDRAALNLLLLEIKGRFAFDLKYYVTKSMTLSRCFRGEKKIPLNSNHLP